MTTVINGFTGLSVNITGSFLIEFNHSTHSGELNAFHPVTLIALFLPCFVFICKLLTILMLPFYFQIFRKNEPLEKDIPIYPILVHFRKAVWISLVIIGLLALLLIWCSVKRQFDWSMVFASTFLIIVYSYFFAIIMLPIFNFLLSLLAIQRFILYFFPSTRQLKAFKPTYWYIIIKFLYILLITMNISVRIIKVSQTGFNVKYATQQEIYETVYMEIYASLENLVMLTTLLYIPIFISVRKLSHLVSVASNKPEKYIRYQAIIIFISKIPLYICCTSLANFLNEHPLAVPGDYIEFVLMNGYGFVVMSMTIELTYLCCNKRNVKAMLAILSPNQFLNRKIRMGKSEHNVMFALDTATTKV